MDLTGAEMKYSDGRLKICYIIEVDSQLTKAVGRHYFSYIKTAFILVGSNIFKRNL